MLENGKVMIPSIGEEVHITRIIASWSKIKGSYDPYMMEAWLITLGVSDEDIHEIKEIYTCGKMELEHSAKDFHMSEAEMCNFLIEHDRKYTFLLN